MRRAMRSAMRFLVPALAGALALASGCVGTIGGDSPFDGPTSDLQSCGNAAVTVEVVPLRRLTPDQFENTLRDLFGDPELSIELEAGDGAISERAVTQLRDAAELVVSRRAAWTTEVFPCELTQPSDGCVEAFLDGFAARAFRRPLSDDEKTWLRGVYDEVTLEASFAEAMEVLLQVVLQAPATVYMFERGRGEILGEDMRALSAYELASRLSYFMWNTLPDQALFSAAANGGLDTPEGIAAEAERLLADPRSEENIVRFFSRWLQLDGGKLHHALEDTTKDPALYPEYGPELQAAMRRETEAFVRRTFFEEGASFEKLLTGRYAYLDGPLAELYGVSGVSGDEHQWVELPEGERAGLFTRAAFLTVLSTRNVTAPIRRGTWLLKEAFCVQLGNPPPNVDDSPVEGGEVGGEILTVRQDVEARTADAECQTCHSVINPLGFAFEHYDAIGRHQLEEVTSGLHVDASASIVGTDVDGHYTGALALSEALAESEQLRSCFAERWATSAFGAEAGIDSCSREHIVAELETTGDMRAMLLAIVRSNAFRFINVSEESP
jgi:hypothetical protein